MMMFEIFIAANDYNNFWRASDWTAVTFITCRKIKLLNAFVYLFLYLKPLCKKTIKFSFKLIYGYVS